MDAVGLQRPVVGRHGGRPLGWVTALAQPGITHLLVQRSPDHPA